jgi:hypothetical protein
VGRLEVRQAIADALTAAAAPGSNDPAPIPYVGTVYPARPVILAEQDYVQTLMGQAIQESVGGSSAVIVVNITKDLRQLQGSVGQAHVNDTWIHTVVLEIFFASSETGAPGPTTPQGITAQEDYDAIVDALVIWVRAHPTVGPTPPVVWSEGQFKAGVRHEQSSPYNDQESPFVLIYGSVTFEAYEWIAGPIGN